METYDHRPTDFTLLSFIFPCIWLFIAPKDKDQVKEEQDRNPSLWTEGHLSRIFEVILWSSMGQKIGGKMSRDIKKISEGTLEKW